MTVPQLRRALERHRLEHGLSYERLAAAISPGAMSGRTVRRFLEEESEPYRTTVYRIEQYLKRQGVAA